MRKESYPWVSQPQYPVDIQPAYAGYVTSARIWSIGSTALSEAVPNKLGAYAKTGTISITPSPSGVGAKGDGSTGLYSRTVSVVPQAMWIAVQFVCNTVTAAQKVAYSLGSTAVTTGAYCAISNGDSVSSNLVFQLRAIDSSVAIAKTGPVPVVGNVYSCIAVFPSNLKADAYAYVNGVKYTTDFTGSSDITFVGANTLVNEAVGALKRGTTAVYSNDTILFTARGFGQIPEWLAEQISENPYSILQIAKRNRPSGSTGTTHGCSGVVVGSGAALSGAAAHSLKHVCSGILAGDGSVISGVSKRYPKHASSGVIVGTGALTSGVANRVGAATTHACTGYLTGVGASISGSSKKYFRHVCNSTLIGQGASTVGVARQVKKHVATGTMVGQGGVINGLAARPFTLVLPLTPLQANGDLVNSEWLTRQLLALGGNMQVNVGAMSDFDSVNRESIDVNKSPADTNGASVDKEDLFRKLK